MHRPPSSIGRTGRQIRRTLGKPAQRLCCRLTKRVSLNALIGRGLRRLTGLARDSKYLVAAFRAAQSSRSFVEAWAVCLTRSESRSGGSQSREADDEKSGVLHIDNLSVRWRRLGGVRADSG
nr:hypothetical protein CFP56_12207 [Quercus suber]